MPGNSLVFHVFYPSLKNILLFISLIVIIIDDKLIIWVLSTRPVNKLIETLSFSAVVMNRPNP